ncbi:MAG: recombinase family protein [Oliverpabstia sp.]
MLALQAKHKSLALVISCPALFRMWQIAISRFARNTVDVLTIVRELKEMNVPVYFENEQLYSFDKEAELAISLHGAIAQDFPEKKRIQNNGEHKKYIQEDHHPANIS